jgi:hypothetical protein
VTHPTSTGVSDYLTDDAAVIPDQPSSTRVPHCRRPGDPREPWLAALDRLHQAIHRRHLAEVAASYGDDGAAQEMEASADEVDEATTDVHAARGDAGELLLYLIRAASANEYQRADVIRAIGPLMGLTWVVQQIDQLVEAVTILAARVDALERRTGGQR